MKTGPPTRRRTPCDRKVLGPVFVLSGPWSEVSEVTAIRLFIRNTQTPTEEREK